MNRTITKTIAILALLGIIICIFLLGFYSNDLYRTLNYKKQIGGLWLDYNFSKIDAMNYARTYDKFGTWICINVRDTTPKEALEYCVHEVGHEIFANCVAKNRPNCFNNSININ